jgi:hypothetical protein
MSPLEIHIEDGWWEVEYVGRDGSNFVVAAKRYHVQHRVPLSQLRPAWHWVEQDRGWQVHERPPPPPPAAKPKAPKQKNK